MRAVGLIRVDLILESAGGVTAPEIESAVDLPLHYRPDGAVWVPPSSLAGSLRAHFGGRAEQFFGSAPPSGRGAANQSLRPSPVRVLGTETTLPPDTTPETRRSTAIDPQRGAAMPSTLRARDHLPAGTTIALFLRYDDRPDSPAYDLNGFADLVASWRPVLGRGRSTGNGRARVSKVLVRRLDLGRPTDLRAWLSAGRQELFPDQVERWDRVIDPPTTVVAPALRLDIETVDALHVGSGSRSEDGESEVATSAGRPMVPGTAWKGLLRSRCGYILRSCGTAACLAPAEPTCGECLLCDLFGWTGHGGHAGCPVGRVGRLTFHDSAVCGTLGRRHHIGIDRFTGGVRTGLLFTDQVITDGKLTLTVTMTRDGDSLSTAERGLLLLALRDVDDGLIGVGRATTRGYGTLRLADSSRQMFQELDRGHPTRTAVQTLLKG